MKQVSKLKRTWNLVPVLQIVQMIPENYCAWLYLSISQVWWLNELWFKSYIQKYTLSPVLTIILTTQIREVMGWLEIQKLEYLENGIKKKNLNLCLRWNILSSHRFVPELTLNSIRNILSWCFAWHSEWTSTALKSS